MNSEGPHPAGKYPLGMLAAYALLALTIAATALAFSSLQVVNDGDIGGPGYRYYTLGVQRRSGPDFSINSSVVAQLDGLLPAGVAAAMAANQKAVLHVGEGAAAHESARVELVTGEYLRALHVRVLAGRPLRPDDVTDCAPVVMLDANLARSLFGSYADAVGRSLRISANMGVSGQRLRVVGIVPDAFKGLDSGRPASAWAPLMQLPALSGLHFPICTKAHPHAGVTNFSISGLPAVLSAPASMSRVQLDTMLSKAWHRLPAGTRGKNGLGFILSVPYSTSPQAQLLAARRIALYLALTLAAVILATINVFTLRWLALVRRRHVLQLERALGATRAFLRRRFFMRTAVVALALLFFSSIFTVLGELLVHHMTGRDAGVVAGLTLSALAGYLVWILPSLLLIVVLAEALPLLMLLQRERDGGARMTLSRADRRIGATVLVAEVLLASMMSCAAGWAIRYAWQQRHADLGLLRAPATIVSIQRKPTDALGMVMMHAPKNASVTPRQVLLLAALQRAARNVQRGVKLAIGPLPVNQRLGGSRTVMAGKRVTSVKPTTATTDWPYAASVKLLAGRNFKEHQSNPQDVLIDAQTARVLFGGVRDAVGGRIDHDGSSYRVIGVTVPLYLDGPTHAATQVLIHDFRFGVSFFPVNGDPLVIRPAVDSVNIASMRAALDAALQRQAPTLQVASIQSDLRFLARLTRMQTRQAQTFLLIALFAWAITLAGVAAHLRLYLALRKRVDAIRQALGASPRRLYTGVVGGTVILGLAGALLALLFTPWLAQQFALLSGAQVAAFGWATWLALTVLLLAVFTVAHFPARRAARAEPAESLHEL